MKSNAHNLNHETVLRIVDKTDLCSVISVKLELIQMTFNLPFLMLGLGETPEVVSAPPKAACPSSEACCRGEQGVCWEAPQAMQMCPEAIQHSKGAERERIEERRPAAGPESVRRCFEEDPRTEVEAAAAMVRSKVACLRCEMAASATGPVGASQSRDNESHTVVETAALNTERGQVCCEVVIKSEA